MSSQLKPSEVFIKLSGFGLTQLADSFAGIALQFGVKPALYALQSALRVPETGEWDDETERAVLHQGQGATMRLFHDEAGKLGEI